MSQTEQSKQPTRTYKPSQATIVAKALNNAAREMAKLKPELSFSVEVTTMLLKPSLYDLSATLNDGRELLSVRFVPAEQVGALPALHARWQIASTVQSPSKKEVEKLEKAGFIVEDYQDETGPWCFYREKRVSHAWVILGQSGWKLTNAKSAKATRLEDWTSLTLSEGEPLVPSLPGCPHNHRTVLRDGLIAATVMLKQKLPLRVTTHPNFDPVMLDLWGSAVKNVEEHNKQLVAATN